MAGVAPKLFGLAVVAAAGCGSDPAPTDEPLCDPSATLSFVAAPGTDEQEAYLCFGFDVGALGGRPLREIHWKTAPGGSVMLHHASLVATAEDHPDGPVACGAMPKDAVGLHVWAPGGTPLELPEGVALALPQSTRRFILEAHVFRTSAGDAHPAEAELCTASLAPEHRASWLGVQAPVPAIRPRRVETATGRCTFANAFNLLSSWPHMHLLGKEFHGAIVRRDGSRVPLVDLDVWDFNAQRTYPLDVRLEPGDAIETTCVWENSTDDYVLPGPFTTDEMCNQGLIGWPADAAECSLDTG